MQALKEKLKGKRKIFSVFDPNSNDLNIPQVQVLMKRINNCKATSWKCTSCPIRISSRCFAKVRQYLNTQAMLKYRDRPEYKKEQEKINRELLYQKIKI